MLIQTMLHFPVYLDGDNNVQAMSLTDYVDTFIYETLDDMISASESASTNGTFTISTSGFSLKLYRSFWK